MVMESRPIWYAITPEFPLMFLYRCMAIHVRRADRYAVESSSRPLAEQTLKDRIRSLKIVHVPSRHHTIQNLMPATLAQEVLHFAAQHDGVACREP